MTRYVHYLDKDGSPRIADLQDGHLSPLKGIRILGPETTTDDLAAAPRDEAAAVAVEQVRLTASSPNPRKVICVGLNYISHVEETKRNLPTYPVLFPKFASNLIGPDDEIVLPAESLEPDYEGEMAIVIGRAGRRIREEDAFDHVLGYSVANDVSMRDYQYKSHQWLQGKAWDQSTPLGPNIITPDEVDVSSAGIRTLLNGQVVQESDLSKLIFPIPKLIATISEFMKIEPGDVILTGTPSGIGNKRDPKIILRHGDLVHVEVDGVGRIENRVATESIES